MDAHFSSIKHFPTSHFMASPSDTRVLLIALLVLLLHLHLSTSLSLKGSVTCLDCTHQHILAGIRVGVKCSHVKHPEFALTDDKGSFEAKIPSSSLQSTVSQPSGDCLAVLLGGPEQFWAFKKSLVSKVVKTGGGSDSYTITTPFTFFSSRPSPSRAEDPKKTPVTGSSKTIDLPLPPEWGLAPSSYYLPFIPIIGIP